MPIKLRNGWSGKAFDLEGGGARVDHGKMDLQNFISVDDDNQLGPIHDKSTKYKLLMALSCQFAINTQQINY